MNIIDKVKVSGTIYTLSATSSGGTNAVEITQDDYDALVSGGTVDPTVFYIITDAQGGDLSNYWTSAQTNSAIDAATSGKVDTSTYNTYTAATDTALASKQTTLTAGTGIDITDNVISATGGGGGGKAIEAGRGITVTTGETADTVSFNLPISAGTGTNSIKCGEVDSANGTDSFAFGANGVKANGQSSFAGGSYSEAKQAFSMAFGRYSIANNYGEVALGFFNKSNGSSSMAENSSGNTLFSVGNGTNNTSNTRHNAFEIRQNGDIYLTKDGQDVKLQDQLGGGGSSYTAGTGIDITNDTISVSLPISAGTGTNSIKENHNNNIASGAYSHVEGSNSTASGERSHAEGYYSTASGSYSHTEGQNCYARKISSHAEGTNTDAKENYSHTEGWYTIANNQSEHASGQYNVSSKANTTFGDSGNTLFSVGNGTNDNARHNAFEIRQNGDIYLSLNGQDVKLQDQLGGSSITVDTALDGSSTNPVENRVIYNKIDEVEQVTAAALNELNETLSGKADSNSVYTKTEANDLLDEKLDASAYTPTDLSNYYTKSETSGASQISTALDGKTDSSAFTAYTAATNSRLSEDEEVTAAGLNALNDAFGGLKLVKLTQAEYNALATKDSSTLYVIVG